MFQQMMNLSPERIGIYDGKGVLIMGADIHKPTVEYDINLNSECIGKVVGGPHAKVFGDFISHYVNKENERKTLGQEVLTMYREINVIYDFSEKLAETIDPMEIAELALEEANALIRADGGIVIVNSQQNSDNPELIASSGMTFFTQDDLDAELSPYHSFCRVEGAEIVNNTTEDDRFSFFSSEISSLIYAPLKVKHSRLGTIALLNRENSNYTAADLKLLTTLALQAASAIESANQYKKNIEEAKSREEVLKRVDRLKDEFLANTSHELRTPLNGIIGLSESLYDHIEDENYREDLSMIISSGRRLANLVNDLLDFSKLKNFDIALQRKPLDLQSLVDIVLRINRPLIKGKNLLLVNNISNELPAVDGDENRLQQVLNNLVGNAIKFTESGEIEISAIIQKKNVVVSVKDSGIGIPKDKQEIIFQEFQQADGSISREFAGTGLGLSISKRLVELHGGEMWLESSPGEGSSFYFSLMTSNEKAEKKSISPTLAKVGNKATEINTETQSMELPGKSRLDNRDDVDGSELAINILIVDDEPINHQVLKNHLSLKSFKITQAMNGFEALQALENGTRYNLVILDLMMPKMNGYEVCQRIRDKYMPSELPVIMVTAKNQVQDLVQGLTQGANDYLAKPFTKQEFLARIQTQLDLHRIFEISGRFVPNEFIKSLGKERITDVKLGDQANLDVTVMFTDIRGYTTLAENMTPEENFRFINAFNRRLGPIVHRHNGFINQYLGDGIMALFPKDPVNGLRATIEIQQEIQAYNQSRLKKNRHPISVGIGLHTGSLVMGITGDNNRLDAAIISDTVNTASRIESLSKFFGAKIILSEACLKNMPENEEFLIRYLGKVKVKGKNNTLKIYECYNGDEPAIVRVKNDTSLLFDRAMQAYIAEKFSESSHLFESIMDQNPDDMTARLFFSKSKTYLQEGTPDNWDGIEIISTK